MFIPAVANNAPRIQVGNVVTSAHLSGCRGRLGVTVPRSSAEKHEYPVLGSWTVGIGRRMRASGSAAAGSDRIHDKCTERHRKSGPQAHERRAPCRPPIQHRASAVDPEERRRESRDEHDETEEAQNPGGARRRCHQNQDHSKDDAHSRHEVEPAGRQDESDRRQETVGRRDAAHADCADEETDE